MSNACSFREWEPEASAWSEAEWAEAEWADAEWPDAEWPEAERAHEIALGELPQAVGHGPSSGGAAWSRRHHPSTSRPSLRLVESGVAPGRSAGARIYELPVTGAGQRQVGGVWDLAERARPSRARADGVRSARVPSWAPMLAAGLVVAGLLVMLALPLRAIGG